MVTLRQLRYFEAVARFNHFGRAADHCAVTQPALSMQIRELEREFGVALIERRHKAIQLTAKGREVAERARRILAEVRDLADFARQRAGPLTGPLHLGVIPTIAPYALPPLLPALRARHPELDLRIRESQTETLVTELLDGSLDLLFLALPIDHPEVETLALLEDRFLLAMGRERAVGKHVEASADMLEGDRLLLLEEGHCLRDQALAFCRLRQVDRIDTFGASSLSTIVQMVANGMGMTLLPEISIPVEVAGDAIKLMRFTPPEPKRTLGLAWRATSPRRDDFLAFGALIEETVPRPERAAVSPIRAQGE